MCPSGFRKSIMIGHKRGFPKYGYAKNTCSLIQNISRMFYDKSKGKSDETSTRHCGHARIYAGWHTGYAERACTRSAQRVGLPNHIGEHLPLGSQTGVYSPWLNYWFDLSAVTNQCNVTEFNLGSFNTIRRTYPIVDLFNWITDLITH